MLRPPPTNSGPYFQPPPPCPQDIITVGAHNFHTHVYNSQRPTLVKFYAPWCVHCQQSGSPRIPTPPLPLAAACGTTTPTARPTDRPPTTRYHHHRHKPSPPPAGDFRKAAAALEGTAQLAAMNCETDVGLCHRLTVRAYPTFLLYHHGEVFQYTGGDATHSDT